MPDLFVNVWALFRRQRCVPLGGPGLLTEADLVFNVKSSIFGALGDNSHDDTSAIQNAMDAAFTAGTSGDAIVYFPAGRYKITSTLDWPRGVQLLGGKGRGDLVTGQTTIQWAGADGGVMAQIDSATDPNISYTSALNLSFHGNLPDVSNATGADTCIRFYSSTGANARPDMMFFENCQFGRCRANALSFEGKGILNIRFTRGCRWDQINGYGIYVAHGLGNGTIDIDDWTYDNGIAGNTRGQGVIHLDGTSSDAAHAPYWITLSNAKIEINAQLSSPNSIIYLTARSPLSSNVVMMHLTLNNVWLASPNSTVGGFNVVEQSVSSEDRLFTITIDNFNIGFETAALVSGTTTAWPYDTDNTKTKRWPLGVFAPWFADTNANSSLIPLIGRVLLPTPVMGSNPVTSPTITSGTGAPAATQPDGSVYLQTDGTGQNQTLFVRVGGAWKSVTNAA